MSSLLRAVKGTVHSEIANKVRIATSNEPQAATTSQLVELANATFNYKEYDDLYTMLMKRVSDYSCPQHIYKALIVIRFLLLNADVRFVNDMRHVATFHELIEYHFYSKNVEIGFEIRKKSQEIIDLLSNNDVLREERGKSRELIKNIIGFSSQDPYQTPTQRTTSGTQQLATQQQIQQVHHDNSVIFNNNNNNNNNMKSPQNNNNAQSNQQQQPNQQRPTSGLPDITMDQYSHINKGESGYIATYSSVQNVTTPKKKYTNKNDIEKDVGNDISGDMFIMCGPNGSNNDPFLDSSRNGQQNGQNGSNGTKTGNVQFDPFLEDYSEPSVFQSNNNNQQQLNQQFSSLALSTSQPTPQVSMQGNNNQQQQRVNTTRPISSTRPTSSSTLSSTSQRPSSATKTLQPSNQQLQLQQPNQSPPLQQQPQYTRQTTRGTRGSVDHTANNVTSLLSAPQNTQLSRPSTSGGSISSTSQSISQNQSIQNNIQNQQQYSQQQTPSLHSNSPQQTHDPFLSTNGTDEWSNFNNQHNNNNNQNNQNFNNNQPTSRPGSSSSIDHFSSLQSQAQQQHQQQQLQHQQQQHQQQQFQPAFVVYVPNQQQQPGFQQQQSFPPYQNNNNGQYQGNNSPYSPNQNFDPFSPFPMSNNNQMGQQNNNNNNNPQQRLSVSHLNQTTTFNPKPMQSQPIQQQPQNSFDTLELPF